MDTSDAGSGGGSIEGPIPEESGADAGSQLCPPRPACEVPLALPPTKPWRHFSTKLIPGSARHRGRDLILRQGQPQWALGKFAYNYTDKDIHDEDVDVYLLKDCAGPWIKVGTYATTNDGQHATVEGVEDSGGRVYANLSSVGPLGVGRHKVRMVVTGDNTFADAFIEVLPANARVVVSDVDGTLTIDESAAIDSLFNGAPPAANAGAADVLNALSARGFYIFYLTARPDWLDGKTHEWLSLRGFPRGIVHTSFSMLGLTGTDAANFKTAELLSLQAATNIVPEYGFGNTQTDADAYREGGLAAAKAYFYKFNPGDAGVVNDDYTALVPKLSALPANCP